MPIAAITGVHGYVPPDVLTNAQLAQMVDTTDAWITERTGIKERHILKGEGKGTSHMGAEAVRGLLKKTGTDPSEVELLICATTTPDFVQAMGRTNDAILYGAKVVLWVRADDEVLEHMGPKVPSSSSKDHGKPFAEVFSHYKGDFYQIDPLLFSPAEVEFRNLKTGRCHRFGRVEPDLLRRSFGLA